MRYTELKEEKEGPGTFVGVNLGPKTLKRLTNWIDSQDIDKPTPTDDIHITLILSKTKEFSWDPETYDPKIKVLPDTYKFDKFGDEGNVLVLTFQCPDLREKHFNAREEHNLSWDFDDYHPHITLSYDAENIDINDLDYPTFPIYLEGEYVEPFDSDWKDDKIDEAATGLVVKNVNTTTDVQPGEIQRQAKKFGNKLDKDGNPPSMWTSHKGVK